MGTLTEKLRMPRDIWWIAELLILMMLFSPENSLAADNKSQDGSGFLIAGGFGIILAILSLLMGVLKIIILGKFSLDKEWFDYTPKKALLEVPKVERVSARYARVLYAFLSWVAQILMLAMVVIIVIYLLVGE